MSAYCQRGFLAQIFSNVPLWEDRGPVPYEVEIHISVTNSRQTVVGLEPFDLGSNRAHGSLPGLGTIAVDKTRVEIARLATVSDRTVAQYAGGLALALVFNGMGNVIVHGSCVSVDGSGVVLAGGSAAGKSTLAALLCARGHTLVSDGMTVLRPTADGRFVALPGPPQRKLMTDTLRFLGVDPLQCGRVLDRFDKRVQPLQHGFATSPVVIDNLVVLHRGERGHLAPMIGAAACLAALRNMYLINLANVASLPSLLRQAGSVVNAIRAYEFFTPPSLAEAAESCSSLEELLLSRTSRRPI